MCGRYVVKYSDDFSERFDVETGGFELKDRYNVKPTQTIPIVMKGEKKNNLHIMKWGLIPPWAPDEKIGSKMINARAETVDQKVSYKRPFHSRRCLIPATGYYEWKQTEEGKKPYFFHRKDSAMFAFAGLFEVWRGPKGQPLDEPLYTYTIITTEGNKLMKGIHERMPVVLQPEDEALWLDVMAEDRDLKELLESREYEDFEGYEISTDLNKPKMDEPSLIERVN